MTIIILSIILLVLLLLIKENYDSNLTPKTFLIGTYLYVTVTIVGIILGAKIFKINSNVSPVLFGIIYFIISLFALSLIYSDNTKISHVGLFIFIIANSLFLSSFFDSDVNKNINASLIITSGIFMLLIGITYLFDENALMMMTSFIPSLASSLCGLILFNLLILLMINTKNVTTMSKYIKVSSIIGVIIFSMFILVDNSALLLKSYNLENNGQYININYPKESLNMSLNFINLLLDVSNYNS